MDVQLSIAEEDVGMNNSITEEVKKDERGDDMDSLKEEELWRSRRERMHTALAAARTAAVQDPAEVYAAAVGLAEVIFSGDVEELISKIESLAHRTDLSAILNTKGPCDISLLHWAAAAGKDDILRLLLDHVGDHLIAAEDDWGNTPLHVVAASGGSTRAAEVLIRRARELPNVEDKKILRMKNKHGDTALHKAVGSSNVNVVRCLLSADLEPVYWKNASQKSPLFLAVEILNSEIHEALFSLSLDPSKIEGLPPIHGAVVRSSRDLAPLILRKNMKLFAMTDGSGGNVFHLAAYINIPQVFELLEPKTEYLARQRDTNGDFPIHIAIKMGYVDLIEKLKLVSWGLNGRGQNILHVAAKYGRASVVKHILGDPALRYMLNATDHSGNAALHLAAMHSQPAALIPLLRDKDIQLNFPNDKCLTAVDIARERMMGRYNIRLHLTYLVLACRCIWNVPHVSGESIIARPEARDKGFANIVRSRKNIPEWDLVKDLISSRMVVATLVATMTFAAGFAVPGGFNGSDSASKDDRGMATMLDKRLFQTFVICNTIAMFCSTSAVAILIWADQRDVNIAVSAYERTALPLKIVLPAMSIAFLTGVTLTVGKLPWLANTLFFFGLLFLLTIAGAKFLEHPRLLMIRGRPLRHLTFWLALAYIYLWRVETYIYDDMENDGTASENSANGAEESKIDDPAAAKSEDAPHHPSH